MKQNLFSLLLFLSLLSLTISGEWKREERKNNDNDNEANTETKDGWGRTDCVDLEDPVLCPLGPCACLQNDRDDWPRRCRDDSGIIDYLQLYYCHLSGIGLNALWQVLFVIWTFLLFGIMFQVTREFFIVSLSHLSERLKISNNVAGVTFLAFGNGATDVFSSITAVFHGSPELAGGMLIGSGVMAITVVLACIVLGSAEFRVQRRPFIRDTIFYLIACTVIFGILLFRCLSVLAPLSLLLLYFLYIVGVVVARMVYQRQSRKRREALGIIEDAEELLEVTEMMETDTYPDVMLDELLFVANMQTDGDQIDFERLPQEEGGSTTRNGRVIQYTLREDIERYTGWKERTTFQKVVFLLLSPLLFIESATMPLIRESYWNLTRFFIVICPIFAPLSVLAYYDFTLMVSGVPVAIILFLVGCVFSGLLFWMTNSPSQPDWAHGFVIIAVGMGSFWIYVISTEILNSLRSLARIWGTSEVILGLTLFAWGNSLVDLVSNTEVARQGFKNMAISACFGASSFTLLFGLGLPIALSMLVSDLHFYHDQIPSPFALSFICVAVIVVLMMIVVPLQGFWITREFCVVLLVVYFIFGLVMLLSEFHIIPLTLTLPETRSDSCES